jgi:protein involved in polysaccharide export with SLBB domain
VKNPGRYAGFPSDSILTFLDKAGGIDPVRGSYRSIRLLRGEKAAATVDLYPFAQKGVFPQVRLHEGDTLVVDERGTTVEVSGAVRSAARFEFLPDSATGAALMAFAEPDARASHVTINGMRQGAPHTSYVPITVFRGLGLEDGDRIQFSADTASGTIMVQAQGAVRGTPRFPVRRGATLHEVRSYIAVEPDRANLSAIYIKRRSVALGQKKAIADALHRLEQTVFTATSASAEEAQIRAREAEMISKFVERAKAVEPEGVVVVDNADLSLEDGDIIVVPEKSDIVMINGEVQVPQAVVWNKKKSFNKYIKDAGGYTGRADRSAGLIMRQNGAVARSGDVDVMPGDHILVLPKVESKIMQAVKDIAQVLYQVAVSSRLVLGL